jgi:uncharacterized protein YkwD
MKQVLSFLAVALLGLALAEVRGEVAKSINGGERLVSLSVTNTSRIELFAAWVSYEGQLRYYGTIGPGQSMVFETYPGHLWKFGAGRQVLGEYRASARPEQSFSIVNAPPAAGVAPPRPRVVQSNQAKPAVPTPVTPAAPPPGLAGQPGQARPAARPQPVPAPQPAGSPVAPAAGGSSLTADEAVQLVNLHNTVRREVGVGAVTWSPELARFAQQWADELARQGKFEHRPQGRQRYGENLAADSSVLAGAKMWVDEKPLYSPGAPFDMGTMKAAHYTQMVWSATTRIGAGKAVVASGPLKGLTVLVCNYSPPGNLIGQKPY